MCLSIFPTVYPRRLTATEQITVHLTCKVCTFLINCSKMKCKAKCAEQFSKYTELLEDFYSIYEDLLFHISNLRQQYFLTIILDNPSTCLPELLRRFFSLLVWAFFARIRKNWISKNQSQLKKRRTFSQARNTNRVLV